MNKITQVECQTQKRIVTLFYERKVAAIFFFGIVIYNIRT
jgi:hypothetical protein